MADVNRDEEIVRFFLGDAIFADLTPGTKDYDYYIYEIAKDLRSAHRVPKEGPLHDSAKRLRFREKVRRFLWSYDVFISYPHRDKEADSYARALTTNLLKKIDVRIDLHETDSTRVIPPKIIADLRRCRILAIVSTPTAYTSKGVSLEVDIFSPSKKHVIPIELGDGLETAGWWQKSGTPKPVEDKAPFDIETSPAFQQILTSCTIWHARRRRVATALGLIVLTVIVGTYYSRLASFAIAARDFAITARDFALKTASDANNDADNAANNQSRAEAATNVAKQERADALDAANNANNNAAAAEVREKDANNRASDANNAANVALEKERIAKKGKELADIEAARQGRISAANNTIASVLDQPNVDPSINLTMVGSAFRGLRADGSPTNTSMNWISRNLPKVPNRFWSDSLNTQIFGGYLDPASHKLSLLTRTKLVVFDLNSKVRGPGQEFLLDEPISENAKPDRLRYEVLSAPNGNTVLWERGQGLFAARNGRVVRLLKNETPPNIALVAPGAHDSTIACYHLHGGSQAVDIIDLDRPNQSVSFDYSSSRVSGLVALPAGGYAWVNSNTMTVAMKGPKGYKKDSYNLPDDLRGGVFQYFGISPGDGKLRLIVNKDPFSWVANVSDTGVIAPGPLAFPVIADDNNTSKLIVDPLYKRARKTMQRLEAQGNRNPSFFLTFDKGPNLVEVQPISAQLEADRPILKFYMPENIRGAGYYWLPSPGEERDPFDRTRAFRIAAWGEDGAVEVCDYDPRPLLFDAGRVQDPRFYTTSPSGRRLAIDEAKIHKVTVCEFIPGAARFRLGASKEIEGVGQYFVTDRYLVKSGYEKKAICVYDLQNLAKPEKHEIRIPVEKFDRKPKPNLSGLISLGLQVLKIEVGSDDQLYLLLQDNIGHRKVMMITQNWQRTEGTSRFEYMGPGEYFPDSLFQVHGSTAVYGDTEKILCLWNGKKPKSLKLGQEEPLCVRYNPARNLWAVGTESRVVFFDMAGNYLPQYTITLPLRTPKLPSIAYGIDFSRQDGNIMAVIGGDSCVRFYDVRTNSLLSTSSVDRASHVKFMGASDELVFTSGRSVGQVYVWKPDRIGEILRARVDSYGVALPEAKL